MKLKWVKSGEMVIKSDDRFWGPPDGRVEISDWVAHNWRLVGSRLVIGWIEIGDLGKKNRGFFGRLSK
jgi:hypothetical protein